MSVEGELRGEIGELRGIVRSHIETCIRDRLEDQARLLRIDNNVTSMLRTMDKAAGGWKTVLGVGTVAAAMGAGAGKLSAIWAALVR